MKHAQTLRSGVVQALDGSPSLADKLSNIKVKNYSLIGLRDLDAEFEANNLLSHLIESTSFRIPKIYTLVSQNRKISVNENLTGSNRIFQNFESFKWSELFFNFFRNIVNEQTEKYIFRNLIYSIDTHITHFQFIVTAIKGTKHKNADPIQRQRKQSQLMSVISKHKYSHQLFLIYILDLIQIAIGKRQFSLCSSFITASEAKIFLNYFNLEGVLTLDFNKVSYSTQSVHACLRKYFQFRGQILFTNTLKNSFDEPLFANLKKAYRRRCRDETQKV